MDWKTSNHMDGSEIRGGIGLQYFAEDGNTSARTRARILFRVLLQARP